MKAEERTYKAAIFAGLTEILFALIITGIGVADYLWERFHIFGYLGLSLIFYGLWHKYLLRRSERL